MASNTFNTYFQDNSDYLSLIRTQSGSFPNIQDFQFSSDSFITFEEPIFLEDQENQCNNVSMNQTSKKIAKSSVKSQDQGASSRVSRKRSNRARNPWTPKEDAKLEELMRKYGQSWAMISSLMDGRTGKQVRDRFLNKLRPNIKLGDWKPEEDELLVSLCKEIGNRWSLIATHLPGRTEGQVKNRFYSHIKKRLQPDGTLSVESKTTSECFTSFNNSPQLETGFDFTCEFDANMFNGCTMNVDTQISNVATKNVYNTEEETYSEPSTMGSSQNGPNSPLRADPTDVISYTAPNNFVYDQGFFSIPVVQNENHVDDLLTKVTTYYVQDNQQSCVSSDIDSYFADELRTVERTAYEDESNGRYEQLSKRKAILELALAKTLKEIKGL